ncbi:flagellar assembly protein FliW [Piscibacillus halophilus]|uniref:Flagellar assembly factor FliW n=1 Tax=Piscibacillus halophilus TaxID=571933 RepID=A0A1H9EI05_9BACI|nr:flagellar assembly protein FliW [Piscibacillus halophilus]SEQ25222.1 flagellar assembly factor FliW [Piscibacillus halophilus]
MKLSTLYLGEIELNDEEVLTFENGVPGFQDQKQFVLLELDGNPAFKVLQSVKQENLAFVVTNPFLIEAKYEFELDESVKKQLKIQNESDVQVWNIVTVQDPFEQSTINLKGPIVINIKENLAKQLLLSESDYSTKHPIKGGELKHAGTNEKSR